MRSQESHPRRFPPWSRRAGVTMVEVLTVISIIGLLTAIILPAVQAARSASRRMQCANNQRQLMLAMSNYHDSYRVFPPLTGWASANSCQPENPITRLFPYLELPNVCTLIQTGIKRLPLLECPSDADLLLLPTPLSYAVNASPGDGAGSFFRGPFDNTTHVVSARDITDGLSSTAGLSENLMVRAGGTAAQAARDPVRFRWSVFVPSVSPSTLANPSSPSAMAERAAQTDLSIQDCTQGPRNFSAAPSPVGGQWGPAPFGGAWTYYSHWYPPNSPSCAVESSGMDGQVFLLSNRRSASGHTGGVNVVYMDGHHQFVSNQVDQLVWRAAGTRNGNEVVGE